MDSNHRQHTWSAHDGYIVSLVERKYSLVCIGAMYHQLKQFPDELRQTITFDNGLEFAEHTILTEKLPSLTIFFADPYRSCQRGSNEYTNRLLRRFVPKGSSIADLSQQHIQQFQDYINNLPRKCLGFLTPTEALNRELQKINQPATLQTLT
jgi:IS30 family transposase